jgi:prepilin-type N-terminal cleavage/methylation domain-containing protein
MRKNGFTLLELIIVIVIIGILATLGLSQYAGFKERELDKAAQSDLKLIRAAERIYRMENGEYVACASTEGNVNNRCNSVLRLAVKEGAGRDWIYAVTISGSGDTGTFKAVATRTVNGKTRSWCVSQDPEADPCCSSGKCFSRAPASCPVGCP